MSHPICRLFTTFSLALALAMAGCISTEACPEGTTAAGGACVASDAGPPPDAPPGDVLVVFGDGPLLAPDGGDAGTLVLPADTCPLLPFYADADGDGFGDAGAVVMACAAPDGAVALDTDCDDADPTIRPSATEACDMAMVDENCSGTANEGCECYVGQTRACPGESEVGECIAGTQMCDATGRWDPACMGTIRASSERCDNLDNDCDTVIDGAAADASCPPVANGRPDCDFGTCQNVCNGGYADCSAASGCETTLGTDSNCGACGDSCGWRCGGGRCNDPVQPALGYQLIIGHTTCVTHENDTVSCWGDNTNGQVGTGSTTPTTTPLITGVRSLPAGDVVDVAVGLSHACAVVSGSVYCWGGNGEGQLGIGSTTPSLTPVRVPGLSDVVQLAAGGAFTCALRAVGTVMCWGRNDERALGDGTVTDRLSPVTSTVVGLASSIDASYQRVCAVLRTGGDVTCWGAGATSATTTDIAGTALQVATGRAHTCVRYTPTSGTASVACWGENAAGQLGIGSTTAASSPRVVSTFDGPAGRALDIAAEGNHTCAIAFAGGNIYCWGENDNGEAGPGGAVVNLPYLVGWSGSDVELGTNYSCATTTDGLMYCWGENGRGELGDGTTTDRSSATPVLEP